MIRLPPLLALMLLPGCWLTRREIDEKVQQAPEPPADETGDTGAEESS